jgi:hypothetical protein
MSGLSKHYQFTQLDGHVKWVKVKTKRIQLTIVKKIIDGKALGTTDIQDPPFGS